MILGALYENSKYPRFYYGRAAGLKDRPSHSDSGIHGHGAPRKNTAASTYYYVHTHRYKAIFAAFLELGTYAELFLSAQMFGLGYENSLLLNDHHIQRIYQPVYI